MGRRLTPDPLLVSLQLVADAERVSPGPWRMALLQNARAYVTEASAALADSEEALRGRSPAVVELMRKRIEVRRAEIEHAETQIVALAMEGEGMRENVSSTFAALKEGVKRLQADAARGDLPAVERGLSECLAAVEELETAVLHLGAASAPA